MFTLHVVRHVDIHKQITVKKNYFINTLYLGGQDDSMNISYTIYNL